MKKFLTGVALAAVMPLSALCACKNDDKIYGYSRTFFAMDTTAQLVVANVKEEDFSALSDRVGEFLSNADNSLSAARTNSYIYKFNTAPAGATVGIDEITYEVLTLAKQVYIETDGYFNPAVYYCEDIYRFAARAEGSPAMPYDREGDAPTLPDEKYITAFKQLSEHFSEVEIFEKDGTYYATKPDFTVKAEGDDTEYSLALDTGGIAKGWCADKVNAMLDGANVEYGYFDFGGSSKGIKKYPKGDGSYSVGATDPRSGGVYMSFGLQNSNLSTSGDNNNYYEIDGVRYCHIINPQTGSPVQTGVATVTLVGGSAGRADALTTALAAMGKSRAAQFINEKLTDCKVAMLIFEDGAGKILTNAPDFFKILNKNYTLANTVEDGKIVLK
ncbi:MAG: FAD:protein FMN transferase [Roseburia sp.]|nr:FAD:protein FMN transferase [Roseburia sp.]